MPSLAGLFTYPIKSCAGVALSESHCDEAGLTHDRRWMVVDDRGEFLSQRELPRLALVVPSLRSETMRLHAPGMLRIELPLEVEEDDPTVFRKVSVWDDVVDAIDEGDYVAQWLSDFLGRPVRLVKLAPGATRFADTRRIGGAVASHRFADAYPLLVIGQASLDDLNLRLAHADGAAVPMNRFRPNVVLEGIEAYAEDALDTVSFGDATLKAVRRCVRCEIPGIDQGSGTRSAQPMTSLAAYRSDPAENGGVTFGMYCVVAAGSRGTLRVGDQAALACRA
jgi:uncharacterized protein YcbX